MDIWLITLIRSLPYFSVKAAFSVSGSETQEICEVYETHCCQRIYWCIDIFETLYLQWKKRDKEYPSKTTPNTQHLLIGIIYCLLDAWRTLFKAPSDNGVDVNVVVCID